MLPFERIRGSAPARNRLSFIGVVKASRGSCKAGDFGSKTAVDLYLCFSDFFVEVSLLLSVFVLLSFLSSLLPAESSLPAVPVEDFFA
jgi:hypothetical protein